MNFYAEQEKARRKTGMLILLFVLAIVGVLVSVNLLAYALTELYQVYNASKITSTETITIDFTPIAISVSLVVILIISLSMLYKIASLRRGGSIIAEALGGEKVVHDTREPELKRLLNVVEEMAIASGTAVPRVYVINDYSINAFAAGWGINDAVIGITRGAIHHLNRSELQGVIAHEFSHILNGDMKMNLRLVGLLHGIVIIGYLGSIILRSLRYGRGSSRDSGSAIAILLLLGIGLSIIGFVGTFFGAVIKALISRQREYLADASAVQFTRQRDGIAGALKKIGGHSSGSTLSAATAAEYSHAYFAKGIHQVFSTHPPLEERILKIDPRWDGRYIETSRISVTPEPEQQETSATTLKELLGTGIILDSLIHSIDPENIDTSQAQKVIGKIHPRLKEAAHNPFDARLLAYALLMDHQNENHRLQQLQTINICIQPNERLRLRQIIDMLGNEKRDSYLPLIDLAMPSLAEMSNVQYETFRNHCLALVNIDNIIEYREWLLFNLVLYRLDLVKNKTKKPKVKHSHLDTIKSHISILFSFIAKMEHLGNEPEALKAYEQGYKSLSLESMPFVASVQPEQLTQALKALANIRPALKQKLLIACTHIMEHDLLVSTEAYELIRVISQRLDCPAPIV